MGQQQSDLGPPVSGQGLHDGLGRSLAKGAQHIGRVVRLHQGHIMGHPLRGHIIHQPLQAQRVQLGQHGRGPVRIHHAQHPLLLVHRQMEKRRGEVHRLGPFQQLAQWSARLFPQQGADAIFQFGKFCGHDAFRIGSVAGEPRPLAWIFPSRAAEWEMPDRGDTGSGPGRCGPLGNLNTVKSGAVQMENPRRKRRGGTIGLPCRPRRREMDR